MNRRERRKAKKYRVGDVVLIAYGLLDGRDPNYGLPVNCYVCAAPHKALGVARIDRDQSITDVLICDDCLQADGGRNAVARKFMNAPDLTINEGGAVTTEQLKALASRQDATRHLGDMTDNSPLVERAIDEARRRHPELW